MKYKYEINEEIARWSTEVYIKQHPELGWWIAFTNPTAGPWKKIVVPSGEHSNTEIYRFAREEERPDLILVNDRLKLILIVEAKDYVEKLITDDQMKKSIRVIGNITGVLSDLNNEQWLERKDYTILSSFLWMCKNRSHIKDENSIVCDIFCKHNIDNLNNNILNIVVYKNESEDLCSSFIYKEKEYSDLNTPFLK